MAIFEVADYTIIETAKDKEDYITDVKGDRVAIMTWTPDGINTYIYSKDYTGIKIEDKEKMNDELIEKIRVSKIIVKEIK